MCLSQLDPSKPPTFGEDSTPLEVQMTPLRTPRSLRPRSNLVASKVSICVQNSNVMLAELAFDSIVLRPSLKGDFCLF